jgi:uncharacterized protein (DUF302 family)
MSVNGLITVQSQFPAAETAERLISAVKSHGLTVFASVDHADNAAKVEMALRPTYLVIFGNPRGGTPLMQDKQTAGIDLPLKALVWEDNDGKAWLTYNTAAWIAQRHGVAARSEAASKAMDSGLTVLVKAATQA